MCCRIDSTPRPVQKLVEVGSAVVPAVRDDGADLLRVADVLERVGVEQDQIGELAGVHGAERIRQLQNAHGIECGGPQSFERSEAGLDKPLELDVQAEAG